MKYKNIVVIMGLLIMLLACKQPAPETGGGNSPPIGARMHMVQFKLPSLTDGAMIDSTQFEGQVLLVTFFATWCPPCIQEIPSFITMQNDYKAKGFSVLAFSVDEGNPDYLKKFIEKHEINYPVLQADPDVTKGFGSVTGIPVTFLINRKGEIMKKYLGYIEHDVLEKEIVDMLNAG